MTQDNLQQGTDGDTINDTAQGPGLVGLGGAAVWGSAATPPATGVSTAAVGTTDRVDYDNTVTTAGDRAPSAAEGIAANAVDTHESGITMRKGKSLLGLKVIGLDGSTLGKVHDLIYDHDTDQVVALLLSGKELFGLIAAQVVPWEETESIGPHAVIVQSQASKISAGDAPQVSRLMDRDTALSGTHIYTTDGQDLGTFADFYIDENTGRIVGYEVSGGFISDSMSGKSFLPAPQHITLGDDVALVPPEVADEIQRQKQEEPGGLQAAATSVSDKVSGAVANVSAAAQGHAAESAIGKQAGREVTASNGSIIVAPGMTITPDIMERARLYGRENEVIAAAGVGTAAQGAETVKEGATNLWDTVKEKAAQLTGTAQEKKAEYEQQMEQAQIKAALGRPVTRVILDESDRVILNTGDLITHAAVEQSRQAGVLDILLDSVYTAEPEITPEMMRAREPGEAALPSQAQPSGGPITATVEPDQQSQDTPPQGRI